MALDDVKEAERAAVQMTHEHKPEEAEKSVEEKQDEVVEETAEETSEEEETAETGEASEETSEEEETEDKKEKPKFEKRRDPSWYIEKRKKDAQRIRDLEAALEAAKTPAGEKKDLSEEEIDKIAEQKAIVKDFNRSIDRLANQAKAENKNYDTQVVELVENVGPAPTHVLQALLELENGPKVLNLLVKDLDTAHNLFQMSPVKAAIEITRLSDKLAKPVGKPVSKAPAPPTPVKGAVVTSAPELGNTPESQKAWIEWRNKTAKRTID